MQCIFSGMRGLYAILDWDAAAAREVDFGMLTRAVVAGGPAAVQLRAKSAPDALVLDALLELVAQARKRGIAVFANDRPDLALLSGCLGVHVGQSDMSVREVRSIAPQLQIGVSTHDLEQLQTALEERPDYVAFGPIFETQSKAQPDSTTGLPALAAAHQLARRAHIPLVAIGGVTMARLSHVAPHTDAVATIGALFESGLSEHELCEQTRRLSEALQRDARLA